MCVQQLGETVTFLILMHETSKNFKFPSCLEYAFKSFKSKGASQSQWRILKSKDSTSCNAARGLFQCPISKDPRTENFQGCLCVSTPRLKYPQTYVGNSFSMAQTRQLVPLGFLRMLRGSLAWHQEDLTSMEPSQKVSLTLKSTKSCCYVLFFCNC